MSVKKLTANSSGASSGYLPPYTLTPITYYVATSGNGGSDANPGTSAAPFLTMQKAIDLVPKFILYPVIINVGVGSFGGYNLSNFGVGVPADVSTGAYVQINGTMSAVTPATGAGTGTATAGSAGSSTTPSRGTLTDSGQTWTTNDLRGKFVHTIAGTGSGQYLPIIANTGTVITVAGTWTAPANGTTYEILTPGTIINTSIAAPVGAFNSLAGSNFAAGVRIVNCGSINVGIAQYFQHQFMMFSSPTNAVYTSGTGQISFRRCTFNGTGTLLNTTGPGSTAAPVHCVFMLSASQTGISVGGLDGISALRLSGCLFNAGSNAISMTGAQVAADSSTFLTQTNASLLASSGNNSLRINAPFIDGAVTGISCPTSSSGTGTPSLAMYGAAGQIDNCTTGVNLSGSCLTATLGGVWAGTGNTTAIAVSNGAAVQLSSSSTITGTTELSVDGTGYTIAAMRAATPKVVNSQDYFSKIYQ